MRTAIQVKLGLGKKAQVITGHVGGTSTDGYLVVHAEIAPGVWAKWEVAADTVRHCLASGKPVTV